MRTQRPEYLGIKLSEAENTAIIRLASVKGCRSPLMRRNVIDEPTHRPRCARLQPVPRCGRAHHAGEVNQWKQN